MRKQEIWAIRRERIESFFRSQNDVRPNGDGAFTFGRCEIRVTAMPERQIGRMCFPQTQVEFEGPETDTKKIYHRFVMQFSSAGA